MNSFISFSYDLLKSGSLFWFCALLGSGMFMIQLVINLVGMGDFEGNDHSSDIRHFKWLSIQAVTGFLMMFGWTALTCQKEFEFPNTLTLILALIAGIFAAVILGSIFNLAKRLKSSGTVFNLDEAIGQEAFIYQTIPVGGRGKISINLNNFTHEIEAISPHLSLLPSFSRVKIIEKIDNNTVVVIPIEKRQL